MSVAILEAATIARIDYAMLDCFVLSHTLEPDRYVVNDFQNFTANLEDGTTEVEFLACAVRISKAEESDQASTPEITLEISNISGAVSDMLKRIRGNTDPLILKNYLYASNDPARPAILPPTVMEVHTIEIDETTASLTGSFGDAGNLAVPALTFQRSEYPGLVR
jgi:hypothetical protein